MKPRKENETDASYIARLESANRELRSHNTRLSKWGERLNTAVTTLACDGSLAFQAMAEKARVRSHPSVTKVVELFNSVSHPQWMRDDAEIPKIEFPTDWDFDEPSAWSGDADMSLNAPIAAAIEYLESRKFRSKLDEWKHVAEIIGGLQKALTGFVGQIKEGVGFIPRQLGPFPPKHYLSMNEDELRGLLSAMSWMALDLAQDMAFANEMLRRDLRASTYRRVASDLYALSSLCLEPREDVKIDVKILGGEQEVF